MAAMGATVFALILWGAILAVAGVFCFELYVVGRDAGWFP